MNILVLNGSPRPNGNTVAMVRAFTEGAEGQGHKVSVVDVCKKDIAGCRGCEYCHTAGEGTCIQKDDMQEVIPALNDADMVVFASPIYYFGFSAQLQCLIHRTYAIHVPKKVQKTMLILSSGSDDVFEGAIYEYKRGIVEWWKVEDAGIYTAYGAQCRSESTLAKLRAAGRGL